MVAYFDGACYTPSTNAMAYGGYGNTTPFGIFCHRNVPRWWFRVETGFFTIRKHGRIRYIDPSANFYSSTQSSVSNQISYGVDRLSVPICHLLYGNITRWWLRIRPWLFFDLLFGALRYVISITNLDNARQFTVVYPFKHSRVRHFLSIGELSRGYISGRYIVDCPNIRLRHV